MNKIGHDFKNMPSGDVIQKLITAEIFEKCYVLWKMKVCFHFSKQYKLSVLL